MIPISNSIEVLKKLKLLVVHNPLHILHKFKYPHHFIAHDSNRGCISYTPMDGSLLAKWASASAALMCAGVIWTMKFSKNGKYLASAGQDAAVRVWEVCLKRGERESIPEEEEQGAAANGGAGTWPLQKLPQQLACISKANLPELKNPEEKVSAES